MFTTFMFASLISANSMAVNQFAEISKDLYTQIKVIESLVKGDLFKESQGMLSTAEVTFGKLMLTIKSDNQLQTHILSNRRLEIGWLRDAIQHGLTIRLSKTAKKRNTK